MDTYYIVKHVTRDAWLNAIYQNSLGTTNAYSNAIALPTQAVGESFVTYCEAAESESEFALYQVDLNIHEVTQVTP